MNQEQLNHAAHSSVEDSFTSEKDIHTHPHMTDNQLGVSDVEDSYPLSSLQHGMLFHALWKKGSGVDIVQYLIDLHEMLDVEKLRRAWWRTINRHSVLRTSFGWDNLNEPQQQVHAKVELPWEQQDWRAFTDIDRKKMLADLLEADRRQGFDMARAPVFRLTLLRYGEADYRLIWTYHHILLDAMSRRSVQDEVFAYYEAFLQDKDTTRPRPRPYRDYIDWLQQQDFDCDESFWRQGLTGFSSATRLNVDHAPELSQIDRTHAGDHEIKLSTEITSALRSMAEQNGLTLATILQGAWAILLSRYSGEADVLFGVVCSNRHGTIVDADDVIGLCINTLPMRVQVNSEIPLLSWLKRVRAQWISMRDHTHTPLAKIQGWSEVPAGHPLLSTIFSFHKTQRDPWSTRPVRLIERTNYPIGLLAKDGAELHLTFFLDRERIDHHAAGRMLSHLQTLLEGMATKPDRKVGDLPLLTSFERHQLLVEWNQTEADYPRDKCIHQLFEAQVERTPDAIAVVFEDQCLTYRELNDHSNQLAQHLRTLGVGPEVLVGLCVDRSLSMIVGLLAILKAGGAYVPLDLAYPKDRIRFVLDDAQVRVLLTHSSLHADIGSEVSSYKVVCLDTDLDRISKAPTGNSKSDVEPGNLAYVIYTSGSTGKPKGVAIEHHSPVALIHWAHRIFSPQECAGVLFSTSICFDLSVFEMFLPLSCGGKIILAQNALQLATLPATREVTLVNMVPSAITELIRQQALPPSVCTVNLAGEPLEVDLVKEIYKIPSVKKVYDLYGPSETTTYSTWALRRADGPNTIGRPIANTQIYLLDRNQNPVPVGVPGQIYIGGGGVARGYWNHPALTKDEFVADPFKSESGDRLYKTGDLARYLEDGNIEFLGRIDHQVKVRGYRIELGEIESVLKLHPAVKETVVMVREDVPGEKRLVAYVRSGTSGDNFIRELRTRLEQQLPAYMIPSDIVALEAFPLTPNGKLDRQELPAPEGRSRELEGLYVAPRTPTEEVLAPIWCEVLNLKQVGVHDNFFELGGHSLLAMQVVARLAKLLKVDLPLHRFFKTATIGTLAAELQKMLSAGERGDVRSIVPVPHTGNLPVSFAQQRLWFLDRLLPDKAAYNIPTVWQLRGQLDALALERSLNELVARHDALRTRFVLSGDAPEQLIEPPSAVALPITDLISMPEAEREARARQITETEVRRPFDLETGPLLRAQLLRLAAEEHLLLLNVHHIASDDWSMGVLCRELSGGYNAFVSGHAPDLPRLPIQYADFAVWQREWLQGETLEGQLAYWKKKLADLSALALPTDRPRPPVPSYQGAHLSFDLPAPLTQALKELSRREGVTLFMTLLAAFQLLLHRYSGQEDIVVGTPIAGRGRIEVEGLIGFFVNTLVLRSNLAGNPAFTELLAQVRETALGAYTHQDLPFERLVEELCPSRDVSRNPLFQVMFVLQNAADAELTLRGAQASRLPLAGHSAKFDLTVTMGETATGLHASWEYSTDLFDAATVERMAQHFKMLLEGIVTDADQRIGQLPLLTEAERHQLLVEWNQTEVDYPRDQCVHQLFEAQVERTPDAVAVVFEDSELTYANLNARSNQLARYLQRHGVKPGSLVACCMERSSDLIVTLLATLKSGGAYVALETSIPSKRLHSILENACPVVIVVKSQLEKVAIDSVTSVEGARIASFPIVFCLDQHAKSISNESTENLDSEVASEDQAYVCFTSGSSGQPKGVSIPHRAIVRLVKNTTYVSLAAADVFLQVAPVSFDASTFEIWACLLNGGQLVVLPSEMLSLAQIGAAVRKYNVSVLWLTAGLFHQMVDHELDSLIVVRQLLAGGDVLSIAHVRKALERLGESRLINAYGPTENTTFTCCYPIAHLSAEDRSVPIGRPISNTQCFILDRDLQPVPIGVRGELFAGGDGLARGYLNDPELTDEKFISNPFRPGSLLYRTGDFARYRSDGNIEFLGRIDNQVKVRGYRIELGEIESVLKLHPAAKEAVVVAREDVPGDRRLAAYVAPATAADQAGELREFLKERLPAYMLPSAFVFIDAFPLTPNGKLDRKALPAPDSRLRQLGGLYVAPRTPMEEVLVSIWSQVLNLKLVGIHDNFFELGGHSLSAVQLQLQIRRAFEIEMPLATIYRWPTVEGIALSVLQQQVEALGARQAERLFAELEEVLDES